MTEAGPRQPIPLAIYERVTQPFSPEARAALDVIEPCVRLTTRAEEKLDQPLPGNNPVRAETGFPPGVEMQSDLDGLDDAAAARRLRAATRIIARDEADSFYAIGAEAGIGREDDVTLHDVGLVLDTLQTAEGGRQDTKMITQKTQILGDPIPGETSEAGPVPTGRIVQCAAKARELERDKTPEAAAVAQMVSEHLGEIARSAHILEFLEVNPAAPVTEYDGAVLTWITDPRFVPAAQPRVIGHVDAQAVVPGGAAVEGLERPRVGAIGDLVEIGSINSRPIYIQDVPREFTYAAPGEPALTSKGGLKYEQPNASQLAIAHARMLGEPAAAVVTSATYLLEHIVEAAQETYNIAVAGQPVVRVLPIAYGIRRMRAVAGNAPKRPALPHMLGALGKAQRLAEAFYADILLDEARAA